MPVTTPPAASSAPVLKIACLEPLDPRVEAATRALAAPDFEIVFPRSADRAGLRELVADADFILLGAGAVDAELLARCARVRLIQKFGVGIDNVDLDAVRRSGIPFAIVAGGNAPTVSEMVIGLIIAVNRRIAYCDRMTRQGIWKQKEMFPANLQIDGMTVGLYGFGAVARMTARRLAGWDVEILYNSRRRADPETEQALRIRYAAPEELLARSDILSVHLPLNAATRHIIDDAALRRMKPDAILINTARGAVIDEEALYRALAEGRLRGAGLDVFTVEPATADNPLFKLDNVVVTPHIASPAFNNIRRVMGRSIDNMRRLRDGQPLPPADVVVPPGEWNPSAAAAPAPHA